ncbi:NADH dehydrogenase subunit 4 (mitochondrion) [Cimex lectularius]|uniref:NADH-ubiquinone oxidoreductase chain 4 n=1 Tax=Cimex lectularius TaxID=79782 RepID=A0A342KAD5_CIMLE|nr:NADH dehydrogenase subunit 4 [Cimex lectularius]AMY59998.1 NADH dehydrogenase subunit 4 [Cimex lectularius]
MILSLLFLIPIAMLGLYCELMGCLLILFFVSFFSNWFLGFFSTLSFSFGGDIFSWFLVYLSLWIVVLMILSGFCMKHMDTMADFLIICMSLLLFLVLCFLTMNVFMFYVYFEATLIPTLFLIFGWGYQPERLNAGFYLLFYMLFASLPLLLGIVYLGFMSGSFVWWFLEGANNFYLHLSMILAFLVKMPMFIFHFWLPSAHVEAPVFGSMILAGVLLKLGGYGLIRVMSFLYMYYVNVSYIMISLGLLGSVIASFVCLFQIDIKCLIAYSSVAHMSLVICGLFTFNLSGLMGSFVLMLGHGLCSSGLFVLANVMYERSLSRSLFINKGFISIMPSMSLFWFMFSANNMSSPPSLNLLGEVLLLNSIMSWSNLAMVFLMINSFMSCCYSIYLYCMTQHGVFYKGGFFSSSASIRDFLLIFMHWFPLNFFVFKVDFLFVFL